MFTVIEVAAGEYGEVNPILVKSVNANKCEFYSQQADEVSRLVRICQRIPHSYPSPQKDNGHNAKELASVSSKSELTHVNETSATGESSQESPQFLLDAARQMNNTVVSRYYVLKRYPYRPVEMISTNSVTSQRGSRESQNYNLRLQDWEYWYSSYCLQVSRCCLSNLFRVPA